MKELFNAIDAIGKADAILHAIDEVYMEDADARLQYMIEAALDAIKTAQETLSTIH